MLQPRVIMLIPAGFEVGLTSISLGLIHALKRKSINSIIFRPIIQSQTEDNISDPIANIMKQHFNLLALKSLRMKHVRSLLSNNQKDLLIEEIIANYHSSIKEIKDLEVVLIKGLVPNSECYQTINLLNYEIAKNLGAEVVLVISHNNDTLEELEEHIKLIRFNLNYIKNSNITGIIINKLKTSISKQFSNKNELKASQPFLKSIKKEETTKISLALQNFSSFPILGIIPWNIDLIATRVIDIVHYLNAKIINYGDINRRVKYILFYIHNDINILKNLSTESMLVTSIDYYRTLFTTYLTKLEDIRKISAILLIDNKTDIDDVNQLLYCSFVDADLPIFIVNTTNIWQIFLHLQNFNFRLFTDDNERIKKIQNHISNYINPNWIKSLTTSLKYKKNITPPVFLYNLTKLACKKNKRIVLPEGNEPRTIKAASICAAKGIATCILLGQPDEINYVASLHNIKLDIGIEIINPNIIRKNYIDRLIELRKNKNITQEIAKEYLEDNVILGTLMLERNEVDGLVSGAIHTTANTVRPALQLIKTKTDNSLVSSIFFMLMPEQVYIYGDCAINQNPTAEQLADIAIQSANSAIMFDIEPRIAMLSYSTGTSGIGKDVEKVRKATNLVQKKRPDLIIDGPIQYDAAVMTDVAKSKAPNSPIAGNATVFIFPDLNSGNITYKAVQRSANIISIGPMLQGLHKPVNDLSRGALVEDIVYTIAITVIQSI